MRHRPDENVVESRESETRHYGASARDTHPSPPASATCVEISQSVLTPFRHSPVLLARRHARAQAVITDACDRQAYQSSAPHACRVTTVACAGMKLQPCPVRLAPSRSPPRTSHEQLLRPPPRRTKEQVFGNMPRTARHYRTSQPRPMHVHGSSLH